jgi:hypothetical protein
VDAPQRLFYFHERHSLPPHLPFENGVFAAFDCTSLGGFLNPCEKRNQFQGIFSLEADEKPYHGRKFRTAAGSGMKYFYVLGHSLKNHAVRS